MLEALFFSALSDIVVMPLGRKVFVRVLRTERYERFLVWLAPKRRRQKNALTKKETLKRKVIRRVDAEFVNKEARDSIITLLGTRGLVLENSQKDPVFLTPLTVQWERLFLELNGILNDKVLKPLNDRYDTMKIGCVIILPYPRQSKSKLTNAFERALVECLGSLRIPVDFLTPAILRERPVSLAMSKTKKNEKILVMQPVAIDDDYLAQSLKYIGIHSESPVAEVLNIIDPIGISQKLRASSGSVDFPWKTLIEMDLSNKKGG